MELRARSVGAAGRFAALVILYAFLVKTVLVLAAPLAPAGTLAGKGAAGFVGAVLCLPSAAAGQGLDGQEASRAPDAPAHAHDASCCVLHCQLQLAVLATLVFAVLALRLRPAEQAWRPFVWRGAARNPAAWRFQARGPPLGAL